MNKPLTIEDVLSLLRTHCTLKAIEKYAGIPSALTRKLITKNFGPMSISSLRYKLGIHHLKQPPVSEPQKQQPQQQEQIFRLKQLYPKHGSAAMRMGTSQNTAHGMRSRRVAMVPVVIDKKERKSRPRAPLSDETVLSIETLLKKFGRLEDVSLGTGLSRHKILCCLMQKYQTDSLRKIKKLLGVIRPLTAFKRERLLEVKRLYDELGTHAAVGKAKSLTRARVQQMLIIGVNYGLFEYTLRRDRRFEELLEQFPREKITDTIKQLPSPANAAEKLGLTVSELKRLMDHFSINVGEHRLAAAKKRYIEQYTKMVNELGYDPATTEMQKRSDWRATWAGIGRIWGSIENFRKEFGIEVNFWRRREHINKVRPKGWYKKNHERQLERKRQRKNDLMVLIREKNIISHREIKNATGWAANTISSYLEEMISEGQIEKIGGGSSTRYQLK